MFPEFARQIVLTKRKTLPDEPSSSIVPLIRLLSQLILSIKTKDTMQLQFIEQPAFLGLLLLRGPDSDKLGQRPPGRSQATEL